MRPYHQHSTSWKIIKDIRDGEAPARRPRKLSLESGYFWDQLEACWDEETSERPTTHSLCQYVMKYGRALAGELQREQDEFQ